MVVPEKILMKKIKKREKMKKQLVANKQAGKLTDEETSNEHSECTYKILRFHFMLCLVLLKFKQTNGIHYSS